MESFGVALQYFWSIILNNPFGVDVPLTEKPDGWFAQAGTENCPRVNFQSFFHIFAWFLYQ